jgi:hypothetical protein
MENSYSQYTPSFIHTLLKQYKPGVRGSGIRSLAKQYNIKGGHQLVSAWLSKWDGTLKSLQKSRGRPRILTRKEQKKHVVDFIEKKSKVEAVTYPEVKENIEKKTKKTPKLRTVQNYGKLENFTSKKRKRVTKSEGLPFCHAVGFRLFFLFQDIYTPFVL